MAAADAPQWIVAIATLLASLGSLYRACQTRHEVREMRKDMNGRHDG